MTATASTTLSSSSSRNFHIRRAAKKQQQANQNRQEGDSTISTTRSSMSRQRQRGTPVRGGMDAASPRASAPAPSGDGGGGGGAPRRGRPQRFVPPSVLILDHGDNSDDDDISQPRENSMPPPRTRPLNGASSSALPSRSPPSSSASAPVLRGARRRVSAATNSSAHMLQQQQQQQRRSASMDHTASGGRLERQLRNLSARNDTGHDANVNITSGENGGTSTSASVTVRSDPPKKRQSVNGGVNSPNAASSFRVGASKCSSVGISPRGSIGRRRAGGTHSTIDMGADSSADTDPYAPHVPKMYKVHVTRHPGDDHTIESNDQGKSPSQRQRQSRTGRSRSLDARAHNYAQSNSELAQYQPQLGGCPGLDLFGNKSKQKRELAERDKLIEQVVSQREAMATENATLQDTLVSIGHRVMDLEEGMKRAAMEQELELEEARLASERRAVDEIEREVAKAHAAAEHDVARLEFERDEALGEIDRLRDELDEAIALSEDYEAAKSAADVEAQKYRQGFENATTEIAALEAERDDLLKGEELLLDRLKVSTDKIKALIETNSELEGKFSKLQDEIGSETIGTELELELEDAKRKISELEQELANNDLESKDVPSTDPNHLGDAQREITELKDEVMRLKGQEGVLKKQIDDFYEGPRDLANAKGRILMLEQEKSKSEETIKEMKQQLETYHNEIIPRDGKDLSPDKFHGEIESALHESNETIARLEREKEQNAIEAQDAGEQLAAAYEEMGRLRDELTSIREASNSSDSCNGDESVGKCSLNGDGGERKTTKELEMLQKELQDARARIDELEATSKSSKDTANLLAEANDHIHELESENVDVHDVNARLQREVDDAKAALARLDARSENQHNGNDGESAAPSHSDGQQTHVTEMEEALKRATEHISKLHLVIQEQNEQIQQLQMAKE